MVFRCHWRHGAFIEEQGPRSTAETLRGDRDLRRHQWIQAWICGAQDDGRRRAAERPADEIESRCRKRAREERSEIWRTPCGKASETPARKRTDWLKRASNNGHSRFVRCGAYLRAFCARVLGAHPAPQGACGRQRRRAVKSWRVFLYPAVAAKRTASVLLAHAQAGRGRSFRASADETGRLIGRIPHHTRFAVSLGKTPPSH